MAWGRSSWSGGFSKYSSPKSTYSGSRSSTKTYSKPSYHTYTPTATPKPATPAPAPEKTYKSSWDNAYHPASWWSNGGLAAAKKAAVPVIKPAVKSVAKPTVKPTVTRKPAGLPTGKASVRTADNKGGDKSRGTAVTYRSRAVGDKGAGTSGKGTNVSKYFGAPISTKTGAWKGFSKTGARIGGKKTFNNPINVNPLTKPISTRTSTWNGGQKRFAGGSTVNPLAKPIISGGSSSGSRRTRGGGGGTRVTTTPKPTPKSAPKPTTTPKPKPTTTPSTPTTANRFHNLSGRGAFGKFGNRRRRGPRSGLSMTPEMLAAAARQRIVNYH